MFSGPCSRLWDNRRRKATQTVEIPALDDIDRQILRCLARDGRMTFVNLGETIGLSANATTERVRRLERLGVISGYHAHVDPRVIGRPLVALVDVKLAPAIAPERFEELAHTLTEVREQTFLTGHFDFQLLVTCRDSTDLDLMLRRLRVGGFVADIETRIVLRGPTRNRREGRSTTASKPRG